ncbi:MAG: class I SAM-dependent methyltransferase [Candidatus Acidiferrales bacterium]
MGLTTFASEAIADFRTVGAVAPSSRYLAQAMLGPISPEKARVVVELGPGTGVMTEALLDVLPRNSRLFAFEINSRFSNYLKSNVPDPRLTVVDASAELVREEMQRRGYEGVDAVVSSLALGLMPDRQRHGFLEGLVSLLGDGVFTQFQYVQCLQMKDRQIRRFDLAKLLRQYFGSVRQRIILRNLPPAFVFACRSPRSPGRETQ